MSNRSILTFMLVVSAIVLLTKQVAAQQEGVEVVQKLRGSVSPPLRDIPPVPIQGGPLVVIPRHLLHPERPEAQVADGALQTTTGPSVAATTGVGRDGLGVGFVGPAGAFSVNAAPPDTNLAVGDSQVVQWVNLSYAVFDKSGNVLLGPVSGRTPWAGMPGPNGGLHPCATNSDGDPIVLFDHIAHRWLLAQLSYTGGPPYYLCIAVSQTNDAKGSFVRYALAFSSLFPDYPKLAVWPDSQNNAYFVSFNMFAPPFYFFSGAQIWALDRQTMLSGGDANAVGWQLSSLYGGLLPSDLDGANLPPDNSPNYFLNFGSNSLNLWKFQVKWSGTTTLPCAQDSSWPSSCLAGPISIPVAAFNEACGSSCIPQPNTSQKLDALGDRLMYRLAYRNFGDHESLVANHSVSISTGGRGKNKSSKVGVRWYELRDPNGSPTVFQQGTFSPDSDNRWMGSIAMDRVGNMALGYSVSSSSTYPSIRYTGRLVSDSLNQMQSESNIIDGSGSQLTNLDRWGDYSAMSIDPVDDCTFWYTTEYLKSSGTFNWSTRIASFEFPSCSSPTSNTPPVVSIVDPLSGASVSGSAVPIQITATDSEDADGTLTVEWNIDGAGWQSTSSTSGSTSYTASWDTSTLPNGSHNINARATDSGSLSATDSITVSVNNPSPPSSTVHIGDLDASATTQGPKKWKVVVTITVHDATEALVSGATVTGNWSTGGASSCTTGSNGQCTVNQNNIPTSVPSVSFTVTDVTGSSNYDSGSNHDPDGDSDGTTIIVARP